MKIDPLSANRSPAVRRKSGASTGPDGAFAEALSGDSEPVARVTGGGGVRAVNSFLSLQEVPDSEGRRRQAIQRGEDLLDRLDALRMDLLMGRLSRAAVQQLASLVAASRERIDDPGLEQVLDEIEIRVAVELAKYDR